MALVAIQLDPSTQQPPAQIQVATLALLQQIQACAHRKAIILGLPAVDDQVARPPAQPGLRIDLPGIQPRQGPARVVGARGKHRQQGAGIAQGQVGGSVHLEWGLRVDAAPLERSTAFPCCAGPGTGHLHIAQFDGGAGQVEVALVEVAAAQGCVHVHIAAHVQACDLGAGVATQQARRAMANAAIGVERGIATEAASATQQPQLRRPQVAVVGGKVRYVPAGGRRRSSPRPGREHRTGALPWHRWGVH
ncbi:hypothetical protein G6F59_013790 [Rhizopus arrhizus]|nr:hypothetical protein G6F59_013790 [Rhizopus arrhizus]